MNKQYILITYKSGATITLDVPDNYYATKYAKKKQKKIHDIFLKQYNKLVSALNKSEGVVSANKYFKWSNAKIDSNDILAVDIKTIELDNKVVDQAPVFVPGAHDKVYLDMSETSLQVLLDKLNESNVLENFNKLVLKLNSFFNKSNVEVSIKAKPKSKASVNSKKSPTNSIEMVNTTGIVVEDINLQEDNNLSDQMQEEIIES